MALGRVRRRYDETAREAAKLAELEARHSNLKVAMEVMEVEVKNAIVQ
jgi:hypothetical protein